MLEAVAQKRQKAPRPRDHVWVCSLPQTILTPDHICPHPTLPQPKVSTPKENREPACIPTKGTQVRRWHEPCLGSPSPVPAALPHLVGVT